MNTYTNYYLVSNHDVNDFIVEVKHMLKNGWQLHGETMVPTTLDEHGSLILFCQALVKKELDTAGAI